MYQGHTGNGFNFDTGYVWPDKNYEVHINSDTSKNLWIVIGILGNWEAPRTYHIDNVSIYIQVDNPNYLLDDEGMAIEYLLLRNYPNPVNPTTTIKYQVPELSFVTLKVYDVLGNEITTLVNEEIPAGSYDVEFDGSELTSGIYFYRLQIGSIIEAKKMVLRC